VREWVEEMNEQEKSLKLAELMGFAIEYIGPPDMATGYSRHTMFHKVSGAMRSWEPYKESTFGLSQFAAILLRFPEVMTRQSFTNHFANAGLSYRSHFQLEPTQANILNEILRMNGVDV